VFFQALNIDLNQKRDFMLMVFKCSSHSKINVNDM
jgi:hypothetical protein